MLPTKVLPNESPSATTGSPGCNRCKDTEELDFDFSFAYQPIVDFHARAIFAHEALVRGVNGESAASVLARVNEDNRYRFDQACRVKAVKGAAELGIREFLSINFLPNAVYQPEACIRSAFDAAHKYNSPKERIIFEVVGGENVSDRPHLINIFEEYKRFGFKTAIDDFDAGYAGLNLLAEFQPDIVKIDMDLVREYQREQGQAGHRRRNRAYVPQIGDQGPGRRNRDQGRARFPGGQRRVTSSGVPFLQTCVQGSWPDRRYCLDLAV
jgi:EAL domain-containing protein (putative c-di-GMP-specific phosphodiesterase class I)